MAEYISKSALVAEINDWRDKIKKGVFGIPLEGRQRADAALEYEILGKVRDFLDTLYVEEVDLKKEFDSFAYTLPRSAIGDGPFDKNFDDPRIIEARNHGWRHSWSYKEALEIAKHFFKLGLKAQKEE